MFWRFFWKVLAESMRRDFQANIDNLGVKVFIWILNILIFSYVYGIIIFFLNIFPEVFGLISVVLILFFLLDLISLIVSIMRSINIKMKFIIKFKLSSKNEKLLNITSHQNTRILLFNQICWRHYQYLHFCRIQFNLVLMYWQDGGILI